MLHSLDSQAAQHPVWSLGVCGFACPYWSRGFYPAGIKGADRLGYLASHFGTVEVNATAYSLPTSGTIRQWRRAAGSGLRLSVKMLREVTHGPAQPRSLGWAHSPPPGHLLRHDTQEAAHRFFETVGELGDALSVVLVQFPPGFTAARHGELTHFLDTLPLSVRIAVELRHDSWWTPQTASVLRDRNIAWVASDQSPRSEAANSPDDSLLPGRGPRLIVPTADFLYVRWLGRHGQFRDHSREQLDTTARLQWWGKTLGDVLSRNPQIRNVYGVFDDDMAGHAPATARRFADLMAVPRPANTAHRSAMATLFDQPLAA